jgi:hypothetical protein
MYYFVGVLFIFYTRKVFMSRSKNGNRKLVK